MTRRLLRLAVALVVAGAGLVGAAATAAAAPASPQVIIDQPPCYGSTCVGRDPYITNREGTSCSSTRTPLESVSALSGRVVLTLYYSGWCASNWITLTDVDRLGDAGNAWVEDALGHSSGIGFVYDDGATFYWSDMVDGTVLARGCLLVVAMNCTAWH